MAKNLTTILVEKSCEAMTMAIEIYNKPLVTYRTDTSIILVINAWEHLLKAIISKNKWAKLQDKSGYYKPFEECLDCVNSRSKNFNESTYQSIKLLYEQRCRVIHYNKSVELMDYMAIQSNIIFFKNILSSEFGKSLIKDKTWYVLPIGSELPFTQLDFLTNNTSLKSAPQDIKNYFKSIVDIQNKLIDKGLPGILIEVNVNLTNVQRISDADIKAGIDSNSPSKLSLQTALKISSEGKNVQISMEEFKLIQSEYPLSHAEVIAACRKNAKLNQKHFYSYMKDCQTNQELAINWRVVCKSLSLPFTAPDKFMYKREVMDNYMKLQSKR